MSRRGPATNSQSLRGQRIPKAKRRAQHVSAQTESEWRYLLVGESDVAEARGSWSALKQLGRG